MARNGCPPPLPIRAGACGPSTMVCSPFAGSVPVPPSQQRYVEVVKCCDDVDGNGEGDVTFFKVLVVDGNGDTQASQTVDGAGAPYTPISEVPCGNQNDYELQEACYQDVGDPTTRYTRIVFIDADSQEPNGVIWLDHSGQSIAEPSNVEPCADFQNEIVKICKCDDVNGDETVFESYVEIWRVTYSTPVVSVLVGTFTDASASTTYTPANPINCDEIGDNANLQTVPMCAADGVSFTRVVNSLDGTIITNYDANFAPVTPVEPATLGYCPIALPKQTVDTVDCDGAIVPEDVDVVAAIKGVVTTKSCPVEKQTVNVEQCDGTQVQADVDQEVAVRGVVTVKQCPEDVVTYDYELVCNNGELALITTITTNGIPLISGPDAYSPTVTCNDAADFEIQKVCNVDGFIHLVTYRIEQDGTQTQVADQVTIEPCVQEQISSVPVCYETRQKTVSFLPVSFDTAGTVTVTLQDGSEITFNQAVQADMTTQVNDWVAQLNPLLTDAVASNVNDEVSIEFCDGIPLAPISATFTQSATATSPEITFELFPCVSFSAVQSYWACVTCGEGVEWFAADAVTPATAPLCYVPTGHYALLGGESGCPDVRSCAVIPENGLDSPITIGAQTINDNGDGSGFATVDIEDYAGVVLGQVRIDYSGMTGDYSNNGGDGTNPGVPQFVVGSQNGDPALQFEYGLSGQNVVPHSYSFTPIGFDIPAVEHYTQVVNIGTGSTRRTEGGDWTYTHNLDNDPVVTQSTPDGEHFYTATSVGVLVGETFPSGTNVTKVSTSNQNRRLNTQFDIRDGQTYTFGGVLNPDRLEGFEAGLFVFRGLVKTDSVPAGVVACNPVEEVVEIEPTFVNHIAYCITDPVDPENTLKALKMYRTDGTFGERMLLTDIDPDAVDCC